MALEAYGHVVYAFVSAIDSGFRNLCLAVAAEKLCMSRSEFRVLA